MTLPRVGLGFDVHPFAAGGAGADGATTGAGGPPTPAGDPASPPARRCVLGGVVFPLERGLAGHSDADVVAHAAADALLGAAGLGDLGDHFPDTDPRWAGADSLRLLAEVAERVRQAGWVVGNLDCTVIAERPRLGAARAEMAARLSGSVGAPVHVKASGPEGIGSIGRGEGVACLAVALVAPASPQTSTPVPP